MAQIFQTTTGYRDPMKAMTLKALEARAKQAQDQMATAMQPQVVADPLQGVAGLMDVLGSRMNQSRIDSAAAQGRQDLASAMAGINMDTGPNMQQIAEISVRDPELAQRMYEQAMQTRQENLNREDTQAFQGEQNTADRTLQQRLADEKNALTVSEGALQRGSTEKIATEGNTSAEGIAGANRASTEKINTADNIAAMEQEKSREAAAAALEEYKQTHDPDSPVGKIVSDFNSGVYNVPGEDQSHPNTVKRFTDALAAENLKGTPTPAPGAEYDLVGQREASKRHSEILAQSNNSAEFNANIGRLKELGAAVGTGKLTPLLAGAGSWLAAFGMDPDMLVNVPEAQAYQTIVDKLAPTMRAPGSGSSSDTDVKMFLNSLPSLSKTPEGNKIIIDTFQAIAAAKAKAAEIIIAGQAPDPVTGKKKTWYEIDAEIAKVVGDPFKAFRDATGGGGGGGGGATPDDPLGIGVD